MSNPQVMTTAQKIPVGVTILDQGNPPVPVVTLPPGYVTTIESDNPSVVSIEMLPDGMNAWARSPGVGVAHVTIRTIGPDGLDLPDSPDVTEVTVANALPGRQNATWGAPVDE